MAAQAPTVLPLHRLDLETYNRIVACGALEGQHVELLDGVLVEMSPRSPAHDVVIERLTRHFALAPARLRVQMAIEIPRDSEPEPDLALVAEPIDPARHPRSALLAVEVAVSSQLIDRNVKATKYSKANIPTYWLIDVPACTVEVRTNPGPDGYGRCETYKEGQVVPCALDGVADLDVAALLAGIA
jgi:Uma2 family endonuclease